MREKLNINNNIIVFGIDHVSGFFIQVLNTNEELIVGYDQGKLTGITFYPNNPILNKNILNDLVSEYGNEKLKEKLKMLVKNIATQLTQNTNKVIGYVYTENMMKYYQKLYLDGLGVENFILTNWDKPIQITNSNDYTIFINFDLK